MAPRFAIVTGGLAMAATLTTPAWAQGIDDGNAHAKPALILETTALVPGGEANLGVTFKIAKGWHLYWRNPGDSGMPIEIKLDLPEGITAGEPTWPAPHRHVSPGDLLDYIYEDEVTLVFPLKVSSSFSAPSADVSARIDFLVCKDICLPGFTEVDATFAVAPESARSPDAKHFDRARERWASPLNKRTTGEPLSVAWSGSSLVIQTEGADEATFYPYETPQAVSPVGIEPDAPIRTCHTRSGRLELPYGDDVQKLERVRGVLEVRRGKSREFVLIDLAPPGK